MRLSPRHPRYRSLVVRRTLADAHREGLVVPEGLIAQGRGEAFDYLLGERTTRSARRAERAAAEWLYLARRPVVSVNGNVAALAAAEVARIAQALPHVGVEVNLFHRTPARARGVARVLRKAGVREVLGVRADARIPGLPSDRSKVDRRGLYRADVCLVPLEDGDRAGALRARGQKVISVDLNPLSRTSRTADIPIVDDVVRALGHIADDLERISEDPRRIRVRPFDARSTLADALQTIDRRLIRAAQAGPKRPRPRS